MKKIIFTILSSSALLSCAMGSRSADNMPGREEILAQIEEPVFRDADYNVLDFGAVGDSLSDCRAAIAEAISRCSGEGGGRVVLPAGKYVCNGPVVLKSNVNLHLEEGAELLFGSATEYYLPAVLTIWEGTELFNYCPPVYAYHCSNIAITGKGTLNGRASEGFAKFRPQGSEMQNRLRQMGIDQVPVYERCFGAESILPPSMIQPYGCRNILIEGVSIVDSPYWVIHPVACDNVTVRGVSIYSRNLNNDGCDPEYTTNVLIEDCVFDTGDDAIAIKAGRDQDAWRIGQPTSGIIIKNCEFRSKCNGLCIGSEMAAGVENVYMDDVNISKCYSGIYFKSNLDRGGFIRNVRVNNVVCDTVRSAFIRFDSDYPGGRGGFHPTIFENFRISNVKGSISRECAFYAVGIDGYHMKDIHLENVELQGAPTPYILKYVDDISFTNVKINGEMLPEHPESTETVKLKSW